MQAEAMRKKLEEKRKERVAAVKALTPPAVRRAKPEEQGEVGRGREESRDKEVGGDSEIPAVSPRKVWGAQPAVGGPVPMLARQVDATGIIRGGMCVCVFVCWNNIAYSRVSF